MVVAVYTDCGLAQRMLLLTNDCLVPQALWTASQQHSACTSCHTFPQVASALSCDCLLCVFASCCPVLMTIASEPTGVISSRVGTIMAGAITFKITVTGKGGHAAMPHTTRDPVVAGARISAANGRAAARSCSAQDRPSGLWFQALGA